MSLHTPVSVPSPHEKSFHPLNGGDERRSVRSADVLKTLDLSDTRKLLIRDGMTATEADEAISDYRCFLTLVKAYPTEEIVPGKKADMAFHAHQLVDSRQYQCDCNMLFGHRLHHVAHVDGNTQDANRARASTLELYNTYFGTADGCEPLQEADLAISFGCLSDIRDA